MYTRVEEKYCGFYVEFLEVNEFLALCFQCGEVESRAKYLDALS